MSRKFVVKEERLHAARRRGRLKCLLSYYIASLIAIFIQICSRLRRTRRGTSWEEMGILLTGRFESAGWFNAHLLPLSRSRMCRRIYVVTECDLPEYENIVYIRPSPILRKIVGGTGARLLTFFFHGATSKVDAVGGFHLLMNGLVASMAGSLFAKRSIYFCVGGWSEIRGGGAFSGGPLFGATGVDSPSLERRLISIISSMDLVVTMGMGAKEFLELNGCSNVVVNPGGIDERLFFKRDEEKLYDFILVARLDPVKRIDLYVEAMARAKEHLPGIRAVIVGDGPLRSDLEGQISRLGLETSVELAGRQTDVAGWLNRSRVFVLCSDSEGVPLSCMEAMMCGLPLIVTDVGDLRDLVKDGENGIVVPPGDAGPIAEAMVSLRKSDARLEEMSRRALEMAHDFSLSAAVDRWNRLVEGKGVAS